VIAFPGEWLVTNGLGGYASGTIEGPPRRRYHGLLIAALPAPLGRTVLLTQLRETVQAGDAAAIEIDETHLDNFQLVDGLPHWRFKAGGMVLEKRVTMPHLRNVVHVSYRLLSPGMTARLCLRPVIGFRGHETPVTDTITSGYSITIRGREVEVDSASGVKAALRFLLHAPSGDFVADDLAFDDVHYMVEEHRGYEASGGLWSPGYFQTDLAADAPVTLTASSEGWDWLALHAPDEADTIELQRRRDLVAAALPGLQGPDESRLLLAADQFVILPLTRLAREARGAKARTIIAGYHWFTDWGRDTMISLEGLTLITGRHAEAAEILRTFAGAERDGLIPNFFPEGDSEGVYHTADATLWFFHAVSRYAAHTGDTALIRELLPVFRRIVDAHMRGTRFGIGVDPSDGLLSQGADGYQLTWMDAKVDGWVVTPRRGKAVEINALWYNALCLMQQWLADHDDAGGAAAMGAAARRARDAVNARFWSDDLGHLYDVVDALDGSGNDGACRPNQIFAISLEHPVLDPSRWSAVVDVVERRLLTPVGLRSLAPGHPDYKAQYFGDLRTRDAAYHQGTVWGWLIGPAVDAWLRTHSGDTARARPLLDGLIAHLDQAGAGSISEIFDAEPPYTPRGCIAQAWSVAEVLRALWKISGARPTSPARR
jgi:predicted glycogen debranching enzyme